MNEKYLDVAPEVQQALSEGKPVVALESTIISHGMPYPKNLETARQVEQFVKENGAVPATIAILKGRLKAGLSQEELSYLAQADDVIKVSRRDIPSIVSGKLNGATTVASTMIIAHLAGIKVFVTGGIGGVHRGADKTFDISADLMELARTSVAVVCAGVKSILDIGATLEVLETHGVPVFGYQTKDFPAFYTQRSGFEVDYECNDAKMIANALKSKWELGLTGGALIGNPIPAQYEMDEEVINDAINAALIEADRLNIKGKEITPFLLAKITELTGEESLNSNIELVYHNAKTGAKIAKAFSEL